MSRSATARRNPAHAVLAEVKTCGDCPALSDGCCNHPVAQAAQAARDAEQGHPTEWILDCSPTDAPPQGCPLRAAPLLVRMASK